MPLSLTHREKKALSLLAVLLILGLFGMALL